MIFDKKTYVQRRAFVKAGFKTGIAYRVHYFVNLLAVPLTLVIYWYLWTAIFSASHVEVINGYTLSGMVSYYVIVMIVGFVTWSSIDEWMEDDVVHGYLIGDMMKPTTYFVMSIYFTIGMNGLGIFIQIIPILLVGSFFGVQAASALYVLLFVCSLGIAAALNFLIAYLTGLCAFWLKKITGLRRVRRVLTAFLAGSLIPLTFFPKSVQEIFSWLPFTHIRFVPVQIFLGQMSVVDSLLMMLRGLAWVFIIYILAKKIWSIAFRKFTGVGV